VLYFVKTPVTEDEPEIIGKISINLADYGVEQPKEFELELHGGKYEGLVKFSIEGKEPDNQKV
jgi:hypothetical protein